MEFHFSAEEWNRLTPEERVEFCTMMAEEMQKIASQADDRMKALYMDLTVRWLTIATEIGDAVR
jgi:hypothetical protein